MFLRPRVWRLWSSWTWQRVIWYMGNVVSEECGVPRVGPEMEWDLSDIFWKASTKLHVVTFNMAVILNPLLALLSLGMEDWICYIVEARGLARCLPTRLAEAARDTSVVCITHKNIAMDFSCRVVSCPLTQQWRHDLRNRGTLSILFSGYVVSCNKLLVRICFVNLEVCGKWEGVFVLRRCRYLQSVPSNCRIIDEFGRRCLWSFRNTISSEFVPIVWRKPRNISIRIAGVSNEIRT
jgi:hypothetical protein